MLSWEFMSQFDAMDITESFVLDWTTGDDLVFEMDFLLTSSHPRYEAPSPDEWGCYARGRLRFPKVRDIAGFRPTDELRPSHDASGARDFGTIDELAEGPAGYELVGDFGHVVISSAAPVVELD